MVLHVYIGNCKYCVQLSINSIKFICYLYKQFSFRYDSKLINIISDSPISENSDYITGVRQSKKRSFHSRQHNKFLWTPRPSIFWDTYAMRTGAGGVITVEVWSYTISIQKPQR